MCADARVPPFAALIVLTSGGDEGRIIEALDSGADDCLAKPIGNGELLARIRARLRRAVLLENSAPDSPIEAGEFSVEPDTRRVLVRGRPIHLTPKEFALLVYMMQCPLRANPIDKKPRKGANSREIREAFSELQTVWRRERDSNPRYPFRYNGFQDRLFQPLTHPSA